MVDFIDEYGEDELPLTERRCVRCGLRGYHTEDGLCLDCLEAELRKSADLIFPSLNRNNNVWKAKQ